MKIGKCTVLASSLALLAVTGIAQAQFKLPSALGGGAKSSSSGADDGVSSDALVRSFVDSNKEILTAQSLLELAYGNKEKAALLQSESDALKSEGVDSDQIKKMVELSQTTNEELAAKQAQQTEFSTEEKKYYTQSLPHFAKGAIGTRKLVTEAGHFGASAKSSMMSAGLSGGMGKMKAAMYVAKATPAYSKSVFNTFRKTISIGKSNKLTMPANATAALSDL